MASAADFGELVLLIGDIHVPTRFPMIPQAFETLLSTNRINHVLCTGNFGSPEIIDRLNAIAPNVHLVRGEFDLFKEAQDLPEFKVVQICGLSIGLVHGHQFIPKHSPDILLAWQRKLGCDILVYGGTHQTEAETLHGKVFLNPGSATGAFCPGSNSPPSFMLMSMRPGVAAVYCYQLDQNGKVNVTLSQILNQDDPGKTDP